MAFGVSAIEVNNLKEVRRALRATSKDLAKEFNKSLKVVATETADDAQVAALSQGSALAKGAKSIKGGSAGNNAYVKFGSASTPFMAGAEFGGGLHGAGNPTARGGYTSQFRPWKGNGSNAGYVIFPTIRKRQQNENPELVEKQIDAFIKSHDL